MAILTDTHKKAIDTALKNIKAVKVEITKAQAAGIDVSEQSDRLGNLETSLTNIKRIYFPTSGSV